MKKWIIIGSVALLLVALAGSGYFLLNRSGGGGDGEFIDEAADLGGMPHTVELGSINSVVVLDATVRAEPGEAVEARKGGEVAHVWIAEGAEVDQGAPIVNVRVPDASAPAPEEGEGSSSAPATTEVTLYAPIGGVVSGLDRVQVGDVLEPGAVVATVAPEKFRAVAQIPANDLYRFYEEPGDIVLEITKGPAAEQCDFLSLGPSESSSVPEGEEAGDAGGGGTVELACRIPSDLQVFDGVQGKLSVSTGKVSNVVVVPATAVRGNSEKGEVLVVSSDGAEEAREVELGITDGSLVEVVSGLSAGEQVVDPIPLDPRFDVPGAHMEEMPEDEFHVESEEG